MHFMDHMYAGGGMWFFGIFVLGVIGALVYFLAPLGLAKGPSNESALDILKKRYAKGEVSKEEFDKIRDDISK